jgi:predicted transcriptional regulator YdeE
MQTVLTAPLTILGRELRTSNAEAFRTIPPFWGEFTATGSLGQIPDRLSDDLYAVYTNFANEGVDNTGIYSLVIGGLVAPDADVPDGLIKVTVPASERVIFPVHHGRNDLVGEQWQRIWAGPDLRQTYIADFERYAPDGTIEISIGVAPES